MSEELKYEQRGVSASKKEIHEAIKNLDKGLFPNAFCKILPDFAGNDPQYCNVMHADTAGTKTSLAYVYWRETGDLSVWKGIAQDAIVMNLDDMACAGITNDFILSSTIGRNKNLVNGDVISAVINGTAELVEDLKKLGIRIHLAGGETADVGDIVRTIDVGFTAFARVKRSDILDIKIKPGNVIVALASYGQATYETEYNGGMGCNGLTSARHDVLKKEYAQKYPESYNPLIPENLVYAGKLSLTDINQETGLTNGKLMLSPTRTYLPFIRKALENYRPNISGMIHCTGGAQTKVLKYVENVKVIKDHLLPIPPLFKMIEEQSRTPRKEMYNIFNMGQRLEIYTDTQTAQKLVYLAKSFHIDAQVIGRVEAFEGKLVEITDELGTYQYIDK